MKKMMFHEGLVCESGLGTYLIGKKCRKCGNIVFPTGKFCTDCLSEEMDEALFGQTGTLFSFTTTYGPVAKMKPPFAVGYIETPEGVRVFAPLRLEENRPFRIGMKMALEVAELWNEDGVSYTGYQYRIAD